MMNKKMLNDKHLKQISIVMDKDIFFKVKIKSVKDEVSITKYINDLVVSDIEK